MYVNPKDICMIKMKLKSAQQYRNQDFNEIEIKQEVKVYILDLEQGVSDCVIIRVKYYE